MTVTQDGLRIKKPMLSAANELQLKMTYGRGWTTAEVAKRGGVWDKPTQKLLVVSALMWQPSSMGADAAYWVPVFEHAGSLTKRQREEMYENVATLVSMANDGRPICRRY